MADLQNSELSRTTAAPVTVQLVVNPGAGSASPARVEALVRALVQGGARVIRSDCRASELAIDEEADLVCIVGGDGTLRHVSEAVRRTTRPISLAVYPAGTVNLLARECGYGRDPVAFAQRLLQTARRRHHIAQIGEIAMFTCASVGPDSLAVAGLSDRLKRRIGRAAYLAAFLKVLIKWPRPQLSLRHTNGEVACEAVYVAKGRFFAGPWSFAPQASLEDDLLHVVALKRARRRDFLAVVWKLTCHADLASDANIVRFSCTALEIQGGGALPLQADGDIVTHLPAKLAVSPEPMTFV